MRMLGTLYWMLLLGNGLLLPLATAHVCGDNPSFGSYVCDPASRGTKYFICMGGPWPHQHMACPSGLLFDVNHKACSWSRDVKTCDGGDTSPDTPTPTPTTTTTTTPPQPTTTNPTTTTTTLTTDTTKDTPVTINTTKSPIISTTIKASSTIATTTTTTATTTNPCKGMPDNTHMCDPATSGTSFIVCWKERALKKLCPPGTFFNQKMVRCDWERDIEVMCVAGQTPAKPSTPTTPAGSGAGATTTAAPFPTGDCDPKTCKLPSCRCVGSDIPGGIPLSQVPQMVLLTFDDRIGLDNFLYYPQLFWNRTGGPLRNPNNCNTGATFFVSNDGNVMNNVKTVWSKGHEIASHSLTHSYPSSAWTADHWAREMQGMRVKMATEIGASVSEIRGLRTPYLALGGEAQFSMMQHKGFTYDSSFIAGSMTPPTPTSLPPLWPFTLHHPPTSSQQACVQSNCPKRSYPGVWEVPLIRQYNLDGLPCSMTDACALPANASPADVSKFLRKNFLRHYRGNRAPFMISLHATWFRNVESSLQGLQDFLAEVNADPHVWQVTVSQMLDWVRHPVPMERLGELPSWKACPAAV